MRVSSGIFTSGALAPAELHVRRERHGWVVTADNRPRALSLHPTLDDALALARALARHGARISVHEDEDDRARAVGG